jgi:hypothetical protein
MKTAKDTFRRANNTRIWGTAAFTFAGVALATVFAMAQPQAPAAPKATVPPKSADAAKSAKPTEAAPAGSGIRFTATTENIAGAHQTIRIDLLRWSNDAEQNALPTAWNQALARAAAVAAAGGRGGAAGRGGAGGRAGRGGAAGGDDPDNLGAAPAASSGAARPLTPEGSLSAALDKSPTLGYVWSSSEISGYTVRYAVRLPQPDGGERIILVTDRRLGDSNDSWNPTVPIAETKDAAAKDAPAKTDTAKAEPAKADPAKYEFSIIEFRLNAKGMGDGKVSLNDKIAVDSTAKVIGLANYSDLPVVLKDVQRRILAKS